MYSLYSRQSLQRGQALQQSRLDMLTGLIMYSKPLMAKRKSPPVSLCCIISFDRCLRIEEQACHGMPYMLLLGPCQCKSWICRESKRRKSPSLKLSR